MDIKINSEEIHGYSSKHNILFAVIFVDKDDTEDTFIELWGAKDENELFDLCKEYHVGDDEDPENGQFEPGRSPIGIEFNNDWGIYILPKKIGIF